MFYEGYVDLMVVQYYPILYLQAMVLLLQLFHLSVICNACFLTLMIIYQIYHSHVNYTNLYVKNYAQMTQILIY
jgi:hypothetical protein